MASVKTATAGEPGKRFLTLADVAEILSTSHSQVYALVRRRELRALQIGDRRQWRISTEDLDDYLQREYRKAEDYIADNPFREAVVVEGEDHEEAEGEASS